MGFLKKNKKINNRSILFVCTANITRSPSAAGMFNKAALETGDKWEVASAGVWASAGARIEGVMKLRMKDRGISVDAHRSQKVTPKVLNQYRWIIVMERIHRDAIIEIDSKFEEKTFVMRELVNEELLENPDMPDPTGKETQMFYVLLDILDKEIPLLYKIMMKKAWEADLLEEQ